MRRSAFGFGHLARSTGIGFHTAQAILGHGAPHSEVRRASSFAPGATSSPAPSPPSHSTASRHPYPRGGRRSGGRADGDLLPLLREGRSLRGRPAPGDGLHQHRRRARPGDPGTTRPRTPGHRDHGRLGLDGRQPRRRPPAPPPAGWPRPGPAWCRRSSSRCTWKRPSIISRPRAHGTGVAGCRWRSWRARRWRSGR